MGEQLGIERCIVKIEAKRIQTFLFAVPRLREMIGANSLLGDFFRQRLVDLVNGQGSCEIYSDDHPPDFEKDPLLGVEDDPCSNFSAGILSREGGHFHVSFREKSKAYAFAASARREAATRLPGLRLEVRFEEVAETDDNTNRSENRWHSASDITPSATQIVDLPHFQVCQASGRGPAAKADPRTQDDRRKLYVSAASFKKLEEGTRFQKADGDSKDIVSLMRGRLPGYAMLGNPENLSDLADSGGYLALIYADGNRVGDRVNFIKDSAPSGAVDREAEVERFFHHMRSAVRASVIESLETVFGEQELKRLWAGAEKLPYQLLMLGGDDLFLVCRPNYALPFVERYAARLHEKVLCDGAPLSIGAGVVVAPHKLPFHRLHALAEELAASAKLAYLQEPEGQDRPPERSVVDWAVITASSISSLRAHRRTADYRVQSSDMRKRMALSAKPYFVLNGNDLPAGSLGLTSLLAAAEELDYVRSTDPPSRSQLKDLAQALAGGHLSAGLQYRELLRRCPQVGDALARCWEGYRRSPWVDAGDSRYLTHLRDLIEILELDFLGRRKPGSTTADGGQARGA